MADFDDCIDYVLTNEGGFSNNPHDGGGATNFGITQATLSQWRGHLVSSVDVQYMKMSEAKAIYKDKWWTPMGLDHVNSHAVATCILDVGVNRGQKTGCKYAQNACNNLGSHMTVDGSLGPISFAEINKYLPTDFIRTFELLIESGYNDIVANHPDQKIFLKGWINRARRMLTIK